MCQINLNIPKLVHQVFSKSLLVSENFSTFILKTKLKKIETTLSNINELHRLTKIS